MNIIINSHEVTEENRQEHNTHHLYIHPHQIPYHPYEILKLETLDQEKRIHYSN